MASRRRILIGTAVVLGCSSAGLWAAPARAAAPVKDGWWTVTNTGLGVTPPAPPQVPSHGLYIENGFAGPTALSAVTFEVGAGDAVGSITLKIAGNPVITGPPIACPITPAGRNYRPAEGGSWSDVPAYDCSKAQVTGTVSSDNTTVTFAAGPLLENGTVAAVIKAGGSADRVAFDPPGPDTLAVTPAGEPATSGGTPAGLPSGEGSGAPAGFGSGASGSGPGASGFASASIPGTPLGPASSTTGTPPLLAPGAPGSAQSSGQPATLPTGSTRRGATGLTRAPNGSGSSSSVRKDLAEAIGIVAVLAALVAYTEGFGLLGGRINPPAARQRPTSASSEA